MANVNAPLTEDQRERLDAKRAESLEHLSPEAKRRIEKAKKVFAETHKTKRFAYYIVGNQGAYHDRLYKPGELIQYPIDRLPSYTWKPTDAEGKELAEKKAREADRQAAELAKLARGEEDEAAPLDSTEAPADVDEDEEPAPTPPAKGKATKPAKGKAGKRAADQDIE